MVHRELEAVTAHNPYARHASNKGRVAAIKCLMSLLALWTFSPPER
jgi:hypothetical protein